MFDADTLVCAIVIVYTCILIKVLRDHKSGFDPSRVKDIVGNKEMFNPKTNTYEATKRKMPWMDPVIYYDATQMYKNNTLTQKNVMRYIR